MVLLENPIKPISAVPNSQNAAGTGTTVPVSKNVRLDRPLGWGSLLPFPSVSGVIQVPSVTSVARLKQEKLLLDNMAKFGNTKFSYSMMKKDHNKLFLMEDLMLRIRQRLCLLIAIKKSISLSKKKTLEGYLQNYHG